MIDGITTPLHLGVGLGSRPWRRMLQQHCQDHETGVVISPITDANDAVSRGVEVVIVDHDLSWLSQPSVELLRRAGLVVIGIVDGSDEGQGSLSPDRPSSMRLETTEPADDVMHLARLGIDTVASAHSSVSELLALAQKHRHDRAIHERFQELLAGNGLRVTPATPLISVGGPAGAGATEVSLGLAEGWPQSGAVLIDLDETHPSVVRRLDLALHPNVISAVDTHRGDQLADLQSPSQAQCWARSAKGRPLPHRFAVIAGLISRHDWSLLRPDDALSMINWVSQDRPVTIARIGSQLEVVAGSGGRYELSRMAAASSSEIIGVCDASAMGILRFSDWLVDIGDVMDITRVHVVMNRAPRALGPRQELIDQLISIGGELIGAVHPVGRDPRVLDAAWAAEPVSRGRFARAMRRLAHQLSRDLESMAEPTRGRREIAS